MVSKNVPPEACGAASRTASTSPLKLVLIGVGVLSAAGNQARHRPDVALGESQQSQKTTKDYARSAGGDVKVCRLATYMKLLRLLCYRGRAPTLVQRTPVATIGVGASHIGAFPFRVLLKQVGGAAG